MFVEFTIINITYSHFTAATSLKMDSLAYALVRFIENDKISGLFEPFSIGHLEMLRFNSFMKEVPIP